VPGLPVQRHVLHEVARPANEQMTGHLQPGDLPEAGMAGRIERIGEELVNVRTAKLPGWQGNAVDNNELRHDASGAVITVW